MDEDLFDEEPPFGCADDRGPLRVGGMGSKSNQV